MPLKLMPRIPEGTIVTTQALLEKSGRNNRQSFWLEGYDLIDTDSTTITLVCEDGVFYTYASSASLLYTIIDGVEQGVLVAFFPCSKINTYKEIAEKVGYRLH